MSGANTSESPHSARTLSHAWRALRYRNFKLFFFGQSISLIGNWMTRLATTWLVYRLTHSALLLGVSGFAGQFMSLVLAPFAGVWVERLDRRKLLVWTQAAAAVQSFLLAGLTLTHVITFWEIIVLTALQGLINAFDMPARQSFLVQMVDDEKDLSNAIAINSSMVNAARLIGPAIAGLVIGAVGEGWCFLLDGVSYFAVIASLLLMRIKPLDVWRKAGGMFEQMREGWDYVRTFRPIRTILLFFALINLTGYSYTVLLPVFAAQVLHGDATTQGWLTGASGIGALLSALSLAVRKSVVGLTRMIQIAAVILGIALILFGLSHTLWLSLVLMVFVGFGLIQSVAASNTIIQSLVTEDKRGRVMSYYTMAFFGTMPFGSLLAGILAHRIGAPCTVMISGAFCIVGSIWFTLNLPNVNALIRPIYQEKGFLPVSGTN
ncbi:MAG TPA: MFS transporter [Candidatus Sumerlaeota bacterium]|nr:MFS transporter [Candidatus Sumerlaeota bacterium]HPS00433.1 MFS transporter [Candidatus Sumerlaeota bacterium]